MQRLDSLVLGCQARKGKENVFPSGCFRQGSSIEGVAKPRKVRSSTRGLRGVGEKSLLRQKVMGTGWGCSAFNNVSRQNGKTTRGGNPCGNRQETSCSELGSYLKL